MKNFVLGALGAGILCACGSVAVRVPVMKPAEINMAPYQSVAVGEMTGSGNRPMTSALEEALVNTSRFTVVDRQHMEQVMRELRLSSTDLADPTAAAKLGKVVTAGALIFGDVQNSYREDTNRALDRRPEAIDRMALETAARRAVLERFMKAIVPHQEFMYANFQKDGDIPQLEGGIGWAERGDWKKAQSTF